MELLKGVVVIEDENLGNAARRLRGRKYGILAGRILVHLSFAGQEPVHADPGIMQGHGFQEIESRLVPAGQDVGNPGAGDAERVRQLRLRDILRVQELLKAFVHGKILRRYKSNESKVKIQVKKWGPDTGGRGGNKLENT